MSRLTIAEAIESLKKPGTTYSGADWKFSWPHKFYIGNDRIYNEQVLKESQLLPAWNEVSLKFFGITFEIREEKIYFRCPFRAGPLGYQRAGVVGEDGRPRRCDTWSVDYGAN